MPQTASQQSIVISSKSIIQWLIAVSTSLASASVWLCLQPCLPRQACVVMRVEWVKHIARLPEKACVASTGWPIIGQAGTVINEWTDRSDDHQKARDHQTDNQSEASLSLQKVLNGRVPAPLLVPVIDGWLVYGRLVWVNTHTRSPSEVCTRQNKKTLLTC